MHFFLLFSVFFLSSKLMVAELSPTSISDCHTPPSIPIITFRNTHRHNSQHLSLSPPNFSPRSISTTFSKWVSLILLPPLGFPVGLGPSRRKTLFPTRCGWLTFRSSPQLLAGDEKLHCWVCHHPSRFINGSSIPLFEIALPARLPQ